MKTWAEIISDLQAAGMTYAEIASAIGVAGSTIGDLATGRSKSPRGAAAVRLHSLHVELVGAEKPDSEGVNRAA